MEDKLITLENLDAFLDNVIVDSSVASKRTWSSQKISGLLDALEARISALENPQTVL